VERRHAEDGHDRVTDELLDGAAVTLDRRARVREVAQLIACRNASGSSRSPSAVDEKTSQKRTVTVFRCSLGDDSGNAVPQALQNRDSGGFPWPQRGHSIHRN
jgi:hypothetical protein